MVPAMAERGPRWTRRSFLGWALASGGAVAVGLGAVSVGEAFTYRVRHESRALPGLTRPLRVAVLSDLHLGPFIHEAQLASWVRAAADARPDLAVIVGDVVDKAYRGNLSELPRRLPELRPPLGVYAVPGNHDRMRYPDLAPWRRALQEGGVTVLINQGQRVRGDVHLAGIDDFRTGDPEPVAALQAAGSRPAQAPARILLSHNPDTIPTLAPKLSAVGLGLPELFLAGHTHGGQVVIPGVGAPFTGSEYGQRYLAGWVPAPMPAFVTRGLGVTGLPVRFDCPAELVVMDLTPA